MISLLSCTTEPEKTIAVASRICYSTKTLEEIKNLFESEEQVKKQVEFLIDLGHDSVLEHASATFYIDMSRIASHQFVRSRIASYSQQSLRYCELNGNEEYEVPETFTEETRTRFFEIIEEVEKFYKECLDKDIPAEDARHIIPTSIRTPLTVTMNFRSWLHFLELRCCTRAQKEIRNIAFEIRRELIKIAPTVFKKSGATCMSKGYCGESKKSCNKAPTLKELISFYNEK